MKKDKRSSIIFRYRKKYRRYRAMIFRPICDNLRKNVTFLARRVFYFVSFFFFRRLTREFRVRRCTRVMNRRSGGCIKYFRRKIVERVTSRCGNPRHKFRHRQAVPLSPYSSLSLSQATAPRPLFPGGCSAGRC